MCAGFSGYEVPYQAFQICLGGAIPERKVRDGRTFEARNVGDLRASSLLLPLKMLYSKAIHCISLPIAARFSYFSSESVRNPCPCT